MAVHETAAQAGGMHAGVSVCHFKGLPQLETGLGLERYQKSYPIPSTQYSWLPIPIPNTNTDTRRIISVQSRAVPQSRLNMGNEVHCMKD